MTPTRAFAGRGWRCKCRLPPLLRVGVRASPSPAPPTAAGPRQQQGPDSSRAPTAAGPRQQQGAAVRQHETAAPAQARLRCMATPCHVLRPTTHATLCPLAACLCMRRQFTVASCAKGCADVHVSTSCS
eukprot:gene14992-biopygen14228